MNRQKFIDTIEPQIINFEVKYGMHKDFSDRSKLRILCPHEHTSSVLEDLFMQDPLFSINDVRDLSFRGIKIIFADTSNIELVKHFSDDN